jgi:antitoxin (DNA-binding transcriptional repressor) of toxin-antitoxin stability system
MASKKTLGDKIRRLPITKARINLGAVVKRAHLGKEYFILEKDGIPVAGLMDIDEFEDYLESKDPTVRRQIQESYQEYRAGKSRPAGLLLSELRAERRRKHRPAPSRAV